MIRDVNTLNFGFVFYGIPSKKLQFLDEKTTIGELYYNIKVAALDNDFNVIHIESRRRH